MPIDCVLLHSKRISTMLIGHIRLHIFGSNIELFCGVIKVLLWFIYKINVSIIKGYDKNIDSTFQIGLTKWWLRARRNDTKLLFHIDCDAREHFGEGNKKVCNGLFSCFTVCFWWDLSLILKKIICKKNVKCFKINSE